MFHCQLLYIWIVLVMVIEKKIYFVHKYTNTAQLHAFPVWAEQMKLIMREGNRGYKIYRWEIKGNFTNKNTKTLTCTHTQTLPQVPHWCLSNQLPLSQLIGPIRTGIDLFFSNRCEVLFAFSVFSISVWKRQFEIHAVMVKTYLWLMQKSLHTYSIFDPQVRSRPITQLH